jgi:NADH:ubiquinone oxidoreductase subunit 6 (subunit J)
MQAYISYLFYGLCALSAVGILLTKDVLKGALFLLMTLLSAAALFVMMTAELVAVAQILIYAGGIVIVILFAIMLTSKMSGKPLKVENGNLVAGLFSGVALFYILTINIPASLPVSPEHGNTDRITETGKLLMTHYLLPFELAGILLLVSLIGAAVVSTTAIIKRKS